MQAQERNRVKLRCEVATAAKPQGKIAGFVVFHFPRAPAEGPPRTLPVTGVVPSNFPTIIQAKHNDQLQNTSVLVVVGAQSLSYRTQKILLMYPRLQSTIQRPGIPKTAEYHPTTRYMYSNTSIPNLAFL